MLTHVIVSQSKNKNRSEGFVMNRNSITKNEKRDSDKIRFELVILRSGHVILISSSLSTTENLRHDPDHIIGKAHKSLRFLVQINVNIFPADNILAYNNVSEESEPDLQKIMPLRNCQ